MAVPKSIETSSGNIYREGATSTQFFQVIKLIPMKNCRDAPCL